MKKLILKRSQADSVLESMLVIMLMLVLMSAFLTIILGAFAGISDKWQLRQVAREYLLLMETEGYLTSDDEAAMLAELESYGLYDISLDGTTTSEVGYGERIYLCISGTYDDNVLAFAGGISRVTENPVTITIKRQSTAKQ